MQEEFQEEFEFEEEFQEELQDTLLEKIENNQVNYTSRNSYQCAVKSVKKTYDILTCNTKLL